MTKKKNYDKWKSLAVRIEVVPFLEQAIKIVKEENDLFKTPSLSESIYYIVKEFLAKRQSEQPTQSVQPEPPEKI